MRRSLLLTASALIVFSPLRTAAQVTGLSGWNIFIDAGHSLTANMGAHGYSEAEKNLGVALELYDLLVTTTDIDTVFLSRTQQSDDVGLSQRSDMANSAFGTGQPASWFHSLHSNASSNSTANSVLMLWGQYRDGAEKVPNGGRAMSAIMLDNLADGMRLPWTGQGSYGDCSFYGCSGDGPYLSVNRRTVMPSELSEAGFHSNSVQNQRNMGAAWKRMEAYTFYWSILAYHGIARSAVGIAIGHIRNVEGGRLLNGAVATVQGKGDTTDTYEGLFHRYTSDPDLLRNGFYFLEGLTGDSLEIIFSADNYYADTVQVIRADSFFTFVDVGLAPKEPLGTEVVARNLPPELLLHSNFPNPFNSLTHISFSLPTDGVVDLRVYDILGREVALLDRQRRQPGRYQVVWNGRTEAGRAVPSGVYFARLIMPGGSRSIKMILLK
ncbi:MAG: N-acetylmuramoyl-L-alanine amidase [Candidatus Marinimicrobia bacterium]|nr:N-acetylmuramoyl-L-alanine amidase [Candidatus Neomarinimicrobiota bacterium]